MNTNRMALFIVVFAIATLIMGLSACDQLIGILSDDPMPRSMDLTIPQLAGINGEIIIGLVSPQTGRFATYAPQGAGTGLALEEINSGQLGNARIRFITEDSRSTVEGTVEAFNKLIEQDVPVIIGPGTSVQALATFPIAEQNRVVAFSPTSEASGLSAIGSYIFRTALTTDVKIPIGVNLTQEKLGYKQVATIHNETDPYSTNSDEVLKQALAASGVTVLTSETFQTGETDFSAQLSRMVDGAPEAIFISSQPIEIPEILRQIRQKGIPDDVSIITPLISISDVQEAATAAEGVITFANWTINAPTPGNQRFVKKFIEKNGVEPNTFAAQSYAAVYILAHAIANAGSTNSTDIRDALAQTKDLETVLGKFSFDAVGDSVYDPIILSVENGKFEIFD